MKNPLLNLLLENNKAFQLMPRSPIIVKLNANFTKELQQSLVVSIAQFIRHRLILKKHEEPYSKVGRKQIVQLPYLWGFLPRKS